MQGTLSHIIVFYRLMVREEDKWLFVVSFQSKCDRTIVSTTLLVVKCVANGSYFSNCGKRNELRLKV